MLEFVASSDSENCLQQLQPPNSPRRGFCLLGCKVRVQYWSLLLTFWLADLAVGLSTGMQGQMYYPTGQVAEDVMICECHLIEFCNEAVWKRYFDIFCMFRKFCWPWSCHTFQNKILNTYRHRDVNIAEKFHERDIENGPVKGPTNDRLFMQSTFLFNSFIQQLGQPGGKFAKIFSCFGLLKS